MDWLKFGSWTLDPRTLLIALLPFVVIAFGLNVVASFGAPDKVVELLPSVNGHVEAAARLRMLATWIVMATLGIGAIFYFLIDLLKFERRSFTWIVGIFGIVALGMIVAVGVDRDFGRAERSIGIATICKAFDGKMEPSPEVRKAEGMKAGQPKSVRPTDCTGTTKLRDMWQLNGIQLYLLLLVLPAMVLGAISALADGGSDRDQAARLKIYLYLAAALFVSGLLYLSALLRWPGGNLGGVQAKNYFALVDAYLLCLGAAYSLFIISYYLPVAARLSAKAGPVVAIAARDKKPAKNAEGEEGSDVLTLFDILKVLLALFAPVIAALLGNVVKL